MPYFDDMQLSQPQPGFATRNLALVEGRFTDVDHECYYSRLRIAVAILAEDCYTLLTLHVFTLFPSTDLSTYLKDFRKTLPHDARYTL